MRDQDDPVPGPGPDDDGGMYGVYGEGRPRHIVGDSDDPPRRRPRRKPGGTSADAGSPQSDTADR